MQWHHLAGGLQQKHYLMLELISLSHWKRKTHWAGHKQSKPLGSNSYVKVSYEYVLCLPQTGPLSKIDPYAKPF